MPVLRSTWNQAGVALLSSMLFTFADKDSSEAEPARIKMGKFLGRWWDQGFATFDLWRHPKVDDDHIHLLLANDVDWRVIRILQDQATRWER